MMEATGPLCPRCRQPNAPGAMRCAHCGQVLVAPPIQQFQVGTLILLHYVTFGIFTNVWFNLYHGSLPPRRHDDPSAGKAVGYLFIPFYGLYWVFFTYLRLCDRLNEERRSAGLRPEAPRDLLLWCIIIGLIPYVGLISYLILWPIAASQLQTQFNELASAQQYRQLTAPGTPAFAPGPGACPTCGGAVQPEATFCGMCGARLGPQALTR